MRVLGCLVTTDIDVTPTTLQNRYDTRVPLQCMRGVTVGRLGFRGILVLTLLHHARKD